MLWRATRTSMKSVDEVARELALAHKDVDSDIQAVFQVADPSGCEVRLLEVSASVGNAGVVMPFRFKARADLGIPYPAVLVLLSPEEKKRLDAGELTLPSTWGSPTDMKLIA
jgi:hypothetical protein